jgi:hypothetical protein
MGSEGDGVAAEAEERGEGERTTKSTKILGAEAARIDGDNNSNAKHGRMNDTQRSLI